MKKYAFEFQIRLQTTDIEMTRMFAFSTTVNRCEFLNASQKIKRPVFVLLSKDVQKRSIQ